MQVVHCTIKQGNKTIVTFLNNREDLKVGVIVSLVGEEGLWDVISISEQTHELKEVESYRSKDILQKDFIKDKDGGYRNVK